MEMHFVQGEVVIRQGEPGTTFYILCEGEAAVVKDGVEQARAQGGSAHAAYLAPPLGADGAHMRARAAPGSLCV